MSPTDPLHGFPESLGLELSPGAADRLVRFETLLRERGIPLGLVSSGDADRIMERHVLDSLRAAVAVEAGDSSAYDLGAGAGLPGLVVAIARPRLAVRLVEARRRRAAFLELAVEELGVTNASVILGRVEELEEPADLCFARALASPAESWSLARGLLRAGGRLVYFAGVHVDLPDELPGAREIRLLETAVLESTGPLVIMTR